MGAIVSCCMYGPALQATAGSATAAAEQQPPSPLSQQSGVQQPLLKPEDWFLTSAELSKSRGGVSRSDLSVSSMDGSASAFASTDHYFKKLLEDLTAADVTSIWICGWSLNHTLPLDPASANAKETTLEAIVERAVRRHGVHVRALVWANLFERKECIATRDWMNALSRTGAGGSALMLFDNRLPHKISSHHQKCVVIKRKSGAYVAFMGGVDLTLDRWDSQTHDQKEMRVASGWRGEFDGWLDASVWLEGGAARDVAETFAARWNSSVKPANCWKEELLDFENPDEYAHVMVPPPPALHSNALIATPTASTAVQIVRTFSPFKAAKKCPEFAPKGELSVLHARLKAIGLAKNFVFIEDQYFFLMPQLLDVLRSALQFNAALRVVVVIQRPTVTTQSKVSGYEKLVFEMARPLVDTFASRFRIFTTKASRNLYIHTKLVIVDDVLLSISSANWNRRSTTSDSELGASIVDTETVATSDLVTSSGGGGNNSSQPTFVRVGKAVREFRIQKFAELTGRGVDMLRGLTIAQSCDLFTQASVEPATILERLDVEKKWEFVVFNSEFTLHVVDPDDVNRSELGADSSDDDQ